ncbi:MAG: methyl-accepting chemotaxis protein [Proteocatella sp.]
MKSIRSKILAMIGVPLVIAMLLSSILTSSTTGKLFFQSSKDLTQSETNLLASKAENYLSHYQSMVMQMSHNEDVRKLLSTTSKGDDITKSPYFTSSKNMLASTQSKDTENIVTAYIADVDPSVVFDGGNYVSGKDYILSDKDYWFKAGETRKTIISEPYTDRITGNMVVAITAPVYDMSNTKIIGITGVDININTLNNMAQEYVVGKEGYTILLTRNNTVLSHKNTDNVLKNVTEIGIDGDILSWVENKDSSIQTFKNNGEIALGCYYPIGSTGWGILSSVSEDELKDKVSAVSSKVLFINIFSLIAMLCVIIALSSKITNPLKKLSAVTNELIKGNFDVEIHSESSDEVGQLANGMSILVEKLRTYMNYIDEISESLDSFAEGNLDINLKYDYSGEFGKLKDSLERTVEAFTRIIEDIVSISSQLASGSMEIANGAQQLANGSTEQSSSIQNLASNITEITEHINKSAEHATVLTTQVSMVEFSAHTSNDQMEHMVDAMDRINRESMEIGKIIKTIEDIAFQTNILALNAAVEAARAGASGKGFAVVADEVRNLATKSSEAAKNTTALIENSVRAVKDGSQIVSDTKESLEEVINAVRQITSMIQSISDSAMEEAEKIEYIRTAVDEINSVVHSNSAAAEQSSAASEELSGLAATLEMVAKRFIIPEK